MVDYKKLIASLTEEDYKNNLVNLHIHTNYSDGTGDFKEIVEQAKQKGYKYIAISDHNTMAGYIETGIKDDILIPAVEFDVWSGYVFCHLLAYGVDYNNEKLKSFFAKNKTETTRHLTRLLPTRNMQKLIDAIHDAGGIAVLAHPACYWAISLDKLIGKLKKQGLDGVEVYYPYGRLRGIIKFHKWADVEKCANKHKLIKTGGTDLHKKTLLPLKYKPRKVSEKAKIQ